MAVEKKNSNWKFYVLLGLIFFSAIASLFFHFNEFSIGKIIFQMSNSKFFIICYLFLFILSSFFSIPFLTFFGARIFSFWPAIIYSLAGNIFSMIIMFFLVKWLGRDYVHRYEKKNKIIRDMNDEFKNHSFRDIILLRFFFLIPPEVPNILGGLSDIKFKNYFLASVLGTIPVTVASVLLIKSYMWKSPVALAVSAILFVLMLIIPVFYVAKLRKTIYKKYDQIRKGINGKR